MSMCLVVRIEIFVLAMVFTVPDAQREQKLTTRLVRRGSL